MASAKGRNDASTSAEELRWSDWGIYEVPQSLRKMNEKAYTPQLVSIGPIHHNDKNLKPMEEHKERYYGLFRQRLPNFLGDFSDFKIYLAKEEQNIRRCYSKKYDDIFYDKDEFVQMILLDAVFIMELFLRNKNESEDKDILFTRLSVANGIRRDLALLENQLPMYVLSYLHKSYPTEQGQKIQSFQDLQFHYFKDLNPPSLKASESMDMRMLQSYDPRNFTDFIRYCCCYDSHCVADDQMRGSKGSTDDGVTTARKLDEVGITFEKHPDKGPLLAIEFQKNKFLDKFPLLSLIPMIKCVQSRLQIPQLTVDDNTECILRNLIALEQCHYPREDYISNYVALLDCLIDSKEDVDFLVDKQIIVQQVGSNKEIVTLFNNLLKEVCLSSSCYGGIRKRLNEHYNNPWNRAMAKLKSDSVDRNLIYLACNFIKVLFGWGI